MKSEQEKIEDRSNAYMRHLFRAFSAALSNAAKEHGSGYQFWRSADDAFRNYFSLFARASYDTSVASVLLGAVTKLPAGLDAGLAAAPVKSIFYPAGDKPVIDFPVVRSIENVAAATVVSPQTYYSLAADAKRKAFTISGDMEESTIAKVQELLVKPGVAHDRGAFQAAVKKALPDLPISDWRVEQVFRNNVNGAYSDGGEAALADPVVSDAFPFRAYYSIHDDRARPEHKKLEKLGLSGTHIYHYRDPVWAMFRPPWDWGCRCGWTPLTIRRAAKAGVAVAKQWLETGIEPANMFVPFPPFLPSPTWRRI